MHDKLALKQTEVSITIPSRYVHANEGEDKTLLLFLHGYADSGPSLIRRAFPSLDEQFEILAPNGLFPLPQQRESGWKEAYSWYFAEFSSGRVLIPPQVSARAVINLINCLGLTERKKILCGFSQGGFFLPYVARELTRVQQIITIGTGYRLEDYTASGVCTRISAIHGDQDDIVPMEPAREEFAQLGTINQGGEFHVVPGMTHTIDQGARDILQQILKEST